MSDFRPSFAPHLSATIFSVELWGAFETEAERDAYHARFPKGANVKRGTLTTARGGSYLNGSVAFPTVTARIKLSADKSNGGVNEAGLRRYRMILKADPELPWRTPFTNSYPTREAFEAAEVRS